ncbi:bifunctional heptose 7-phosphate kinase/heptose 1-phosphate adenyltransferase [Anthocerotibacter panamensis]|uniref:bifunctional heptose 7-phosphate kinase/heptose 1-phosphate adenyltransferase n=1 Tax=Anthocerotibacter panamensis TaxID=2857077 RepID=UPI001C403572|nr:PfkB family carbohydrate kinase [Anthocerotibacter panamensis]
MLKTQLASVIHRFGTSTQKVLVVGDLTLDEFVTGAVERLSREAPVVIVRHEQTRQVPGGAANALENLASLGVQTIAVGVLGKDRQAEALRGLLEARGVITSALVVDDQRPTVTKTRIAAHARQSVTQQIVRIDRKSDAPLDPAIEAQLLDHIRTWLPEVAVVVCSDYMEGVLTPAVIALCLEHPYVIVDTHLQLDRYQGAALFTPNVPEAELAAGFAITDPGSLQRAGAELLRQTRARQVLITRGELGMSLFLATGEQYDIPAFNRTQVFDVTGAGDTVVAGWTAAHLSGGTPQAAAILGNLAASIVVRRFGTSSTTPAELLEHLEQLTWTPDWML